ncbi:hypothetical protein B0T16DRAFT_106460 [Cercophora newfieldiana]|uniref:Uncharacterized protein n=1 Tax=Cercophora newfieldiana TaxID=92897 RepID=A0AA40CW50_9PEZI|nr:hypothetical protein B0T16DRAFT_106460 [Cercophora newfieldiana]
MDLGQRSIWIRTHLHDFQTFRRRTNKVRAFFCIVFVSYIDCILGSCCLCELANPLFGRGCMLWNVSQVSCHDRLSFFPIFVACLSVFTTKWFFVFLIGRARQGKQWKACLSGIAELRWMPFTP